MLSVRNIETWYGPVNAIKGVSIDVAPGRIVAVLGANGAGKTTLLKTIAGVVDPFKGSVSFEGVSIDRLDPDVVARRGVVLVPEGRQIFPFLSVHENLLMGTFARAAKTDVDADMARIYEWFPRLRERVKQDAGLLSGGEQQMLAIGRALMARPKLLLLDEPSLGLSPLLTREIFHIIARINNETGTTVLLVEQNAAIALATAHDGYVMELGRIVAAGTCAELSQKDDVKEFYLGVGAAADKGSGPAVETAEDMEMMVEEASLSLAATRRPSCSVPARIIWKSRPALRHKQKGIWYSVSWSEYFARARAIGLALADAGLVQGDVVTVLAENRPEWAYVDLGAQCMGLIGNGIYPTSSPEQAEYILRDSQTSVVVVEDDEQLDKVLAVARTVPCSSSLSSSR